MHWLLTTYLFQSRTVDSVEETSDELWSTCVGAVGDIHWIKCLELLFPIVVKVDNPMGALLIVMKNDRLLEGLGCTKVPTMSQSTISRKCILYRTSAWDIHTQQRLCTHRTIGLYRKFVIYHRPIRRVDLRGKWWVVMGNKNCTKLACSRQGVKYRMYTVI